MLTRMMREYLKIWVMNSRDNNPSIKILGEMSNFANYLLKTHSYSYVNFSAECALNLS